MGLLEDMSRAYSQPDPNPYLFELGQRVRLRLGRSGDGQTPVAWDGAECVVDRRYTTGLHKEHWYVLRHGDGRLAEFREDEIDARFARRAILTQANGGKQ